MKFVLGFFCLLFSLSVFAQDLNSDATLDQEFDESNAVEEDIADQVQAPAVEAPPVVTTPPPAVGAKPKVSKPVAEAPPPVQPKLPRIQSGTVNVGGGEKTIQVQHPNAAKGLLKIKKDGSYQYKVKLREKSQSTTIGVATFTSPRITNTAAGITYTSMYGSNPIGVVANYEWMPFRSFGALGLLLESGISVARGRGKLQDGGTSEETYQLFVVPLTAFLKYRFEYTRRQWVVPYILGGGTYYGLYEVRDDGQTTSAGSSAVGGGGGIHINLSRLDPEGAFRLDREWGVADMWLTLEMRVMQGLKQAMDFSNNTIQAGITLDY